MKKIFYAIFMAIILCSCKKYLDIKSDKTLVVPLTLQDAQALLDAYGRLNNSYPSSGSISDDDFYVSDVFFNTMTTAN